LSEFQIVGFEDDRFSIFILKPSKKVITSPYQYKLMLTQCEYRLAVILFIHKKTPPEAMLQGVKFNRYTVSF